MSVIAPSVDQRIAELERRVRVAEGERDSAAKQARINAESLVSQKAAYKREIDRIYDDMRDLVVEVNGKAVSLYAIFEEPKKFGAWTRCREFGHGLECQASLEGGKHWSDR